MSFSRIHALLTKEALDLWRARSAMVAPLFMLLVLGVPFLIVLGIPYFTGERLASDSDTRHGLEMSRNYWPELQRLPAEAMAEAFIFHQFLMMLILVPVTGSMSLAAHSIIGEKQARTLEPLLATPTTTTELLVSKVLGAFIPALALEAVAALVYFGGIALVAQPGVVEALLTVRTLLVLLLAGPLATLIALQIVVVASSRVNDPRTAQQFGTLIVLPIVAVLVAQGVGVLWLTVPLVLGASAVLLVVWIVLLAVGVVLFERERILTKWK